MVFAWQCYQGLVRVGAWKGLTWGWSHGVEYTTVATASDGFRFEPRRRFFG